MNYAIVDSKGFSIAELTGLIAILIQQSYNFCPPGV
jgi:hypothetical protein